jgi:hypothetical protein
MTLGSVQPGHQTVLSVAKDAVNAIPAGSLCVRDTSISPNGYKKAPAAAGGTGPFVVCVNKDAKAADTAFAAAFPGTFVTVTAQGAIAPGAPVYASATVAGAVAGAGTGDIAGRYLGHENELTGKIPGTSAADGETNIVIRLGGSN